MFHFELLLVCALSVDEQTIVFSGRHVNKIIISYKNGGGVFQADFICDRGYTYFFFMRNEVVPK